METIFEVSYEDEDWSNERRFFRSEKDAIAYAHSVSVDWLMKDVKRGYNTIEDVQSDIDNPEFYFSDICVVDHELN